MPNVLFPQALLFDPIVPLLCVIIMSMDYWTNAFLKFAKTIQPGWSATVWASVLLSLLKLIGPRRRVAADNIALVFPEKSPTEKKKILTESYKSMVWTCLEMLAWQRDPALVDKWTVEVEGKQYIDDAFAKGRGIIAVSAHLGNWEHTAAWIGRNCRGVGIARHSDSLWQKKIIQALRTSTGLRILGKEEPMTKAIAVLRRNDTLGLLSDQHGGREGIKVPFFGQETSTVQGAAVFAYLTGAPIIPIQSYRLEPFHFKIILAPPIKYVKSADRKSTIRDITILVNRELEKMIRRAPGQWLWQHRRFREIIKG